MRIVGSDTNSRAGNTTVCLPIVAFGARPGIAGSDLKPMSRFGLRGTIAYSRSLPLPRPRRQARLSTPHCKVGT